MMVDDDLARQRGIQQVASDEASHLCGEPPSVEADASFCASLLERLVVQVEGSSVPTLLEWVARPNEVDLADGERISGATTPTLQIADVGQPDAGAYRCVVSGECGAANSIVATLTIVAPPGDFDYDGDLDQEDFGHFQACFSGFSVPQNDPDCQLAKFDDDADVDQADLQAFMACMSGANVPFNTACLE